MCSLRGALDVFSHLCLRAATRGSAVVTSLWMWSSARWIKLPGSHSFHRAGTWLTQDSFSLKQSHNSLPREPHCQHPEAFLVFPHSPALPWDGPAAAFAFTGSVLWDLSLYRSFICRDWGLPSSGHCPPFFLPCVYKKGRREFPHTRQACIFIASHPVNRKLLSLKRRSLVT